MKLSYQCVWLGRNNRIARDFLPRLLICPGVIKTSKSEYFLIFQLEILPRERRFFEVDLIRLIEAGCRHDTALMSERFPVDRKLWRGLSPRIHTKSPER